jgi:hypothetical protein
MNKGNTMKKHHNQEPYIEVNSIEESSMANESRRKFLRGLSFFVGGTVAAALVSGNSLSVAMAHSLNPVSEGNDLLSDGKIFPLKQLKQLKDICAIVIPKTDTLGAAEVNTHGFIDNQLFHCYGKAKQTKMKLLLTLINDVAKKHLSLSFTELSQDQQFKLLTELDQGKANFDKKQRADFKVLKQLICFGYYTSEVGASQELRYLAVPGGYKGSIPYKDSDVSWGSQGLYY